MTALLQLQGVRQRFVRRLGLAGRALRRLGAPLREEAVLAVDGVDLAVAEGEVVGLVGESGCGKSTLGRIAAGLLEPSEGRVLWRDRLLTGRSLAERKKLSLDVQVIFQDPYASLNPRRQVRDIVGEAPVVHGLVHRAGLDAFLDALLARVGLDGSAKDRYPHQFSGGQRQRIGIARALAVEPRLLVCDEAVSALDVSIQAQILNLFMRLREELRLTYLFISHNLGVIEHIADRVVVMYLGRVVETAPTEALFAAPNHPYTQALLQDVPRLDRRQRSFRPIAGEVPSPLAPPGGCHFHPRCPHAFARCRTEAPALKPVAPGRLAACHRNDGV